MCEYVFVIYSCKKNIEIATKMYDLYFKNKEILSELKLQVLIMYGDKSLSQEFEIKENKYLVLQVEDDYEYLHLKSLQLFKAIKNLYPNIIGCFKCDDDIIINMNSLIYFIKTNNNFDYSGKAVIIKEQKNNNSHLIANKKINILKTINTPTSIYCAGPLYYVSNKSISIISDVIIDEIQDIFYEDLMIGYILNKHRIYPVQSFLYNDYISEFNDYSFHNTKKKHTLFLRIHGGLGNQLFQVSTGFALAQKNNMNLFIVNSSCIKESFTHIDDNNYLLDTIFANFPKIDIKYINLNILKQYKEKEEECFTYNSNIFFNDDVYLNGYFQNEKYFLSDKNNLIEEFKNNMIYKNFKNKINIELVSNSYFIHVRRGDYLNSNIYKIDYDKYYKMAIKHILSITPKAHFFIVSDDIQYCNTFSCLKQINKTLIDLPALETLYLMSLCEKGGICANSTFSWWGSYLNESPQKVVTFPGKWLKNTWNNDIYYKDSVVIPL